MLLLVCPRTGVFAKAYNTDEIVEFEKAMLSNGMEKTDDITASGGKYISVLKRDNVTDPSVFESADALLEIDVSESAVYSLWIRVLIDHAGKDSFHYQIDSEKWVTKFYQDNVSEEWQWLKIGTAPLTAGVHTFGLTAREAGAQFDLLYITKDDATVPTQTKTNSQGKPSFSTPEPTPTPTVPEKKPVAEMFDLERSPSYKTDTIIEAESGMLANLMTIGEDSMASGGKYIYVPKAENMSDANNIIIPDASYIVDIEQEGGYCAWYRVLFKDGGNDTFWYRWDDDVWSQGYNIPEDGWVWASCGGKQLTAGKHVFQINYREAGGKFDLFYISSDMMSAPTETTYSDDGTVSFDFPKEADNYTNIKEDFETGTPEGFSASKTITVNNMSELEEAVQLLVPGDEILLGDGVYTGRLIDIKAKGTKQNPIRIAAKNSGKAVFSGNVGIKLNGCSYVELSGLSFENAIFDVSDKTTNRVASMQLEVSGSDHCRVTNNYFMRCGTIGSNNSAYSNIVSVRNGSSYNRFDHNTFDDPYSMQIAVAVTSSGINSNNRFNKIDYNHFLNVKKVNDVHTGENVETNGMECIQLGASVNSVRLNTIVENNLFENVIGDTSEIISSKSSNNLFRNNTFIDCDSGLTIRYGNGNRADSNYFRDTTWGIRLYGANHLIANNYMENISQNAIYLGRGTQSGLYMRPSNVLIENNTVINAGLSAVSIDPGTKMKPTDLTAENIKVYSNSVVTNAAAAYRSADVTDVDYRDNRALILYGAAPTKQSGGIEYFTSTDDMAMPAPPVPITTDEAGALWKKGMSTNEKYIDKTAQAVALALGRPQAYANGEKTHVDVANAAVVPIEINGRTLVPARFIAENMGYEVGWSEQDRKVTISDGTKLLELVLDSDILYVNGEAQQMDTYAREMEGRTLVPLRVISETLGKNVFWSNCGLIIITPENITLENDYNKIYTHDLRYTDCTSIAKIMLALGGFGVSPTYSTAVDTDNFNMHSTTESGTVVEIVNSALFEGCEGDSRLTYDGNAETLAAVGLMGQWIEYELAEEAEIKYIYIMFNKADLRVAYFDVQTSADGVNFETVARYEADGKSVGETFAFDAPQTAKYFRIVLNETSEGSWSGIKEISFMK